MAASFKPRIGVHAEVDGERAVLRDHFGVLPTVELPRVEGVIFSRLAAGATPDEVRRWARRVEKLSLTPRGLTRLVERFRELGLAENAQARRERRAVFERHVVDHSLRLPTCEVSREGLASAIARARAELQRQFGVRVGARLEGALCPSASTLEADWLLAQPLALLERDTWPSVFAIVAESRHEARPAILTLDISTPFGRIDTDRRTARRLAEAFRPRLVENDPTFLVEQSWWRPLLLLQQLGEELGRPLRVLVVHVGRLDDKQGAQLGRFLSHAFFAQRQHGCLLAVGDVARQDRADDARRRSRRASQTTPTVLQVCSRLEARERSLLDAMEARDGSEMSALSDASHRSGRAPLAALLAFSSAPGVVVHRNTVLNGVILEAAPRRYWRPRDVLVRAVALAFWRGGHEPSAAPSLRLCPHVLVCAKKTATAYFHQCDQSSLDLDDDESMVATELFKGVIDQEELARRLGAACGIGKIQKVVRMLRSAGWMHEQEPYGVGPSQFLLGRARTMIARARHTVPYYRESLHSDDLEDAPAVTTSTIASHWNDFTREGAPRFMDDSGDIDAEAFSDSYFTRWSSASSKKTFLATVVEKWVVDERWQAMAWCVDFDGDRRTISINRSANLGLEPGSGSHPRTTSGWGPNKSGSITPGDNPSEVTDEGWDRCIDLVLRANPLVLEGEPSFVAGLARRCMAHGVTLPALEVVNLGHSYAWAHYLDLIERAFARRIVIRLNTSEKGELAVTCSQGTFHLLEANSVFEVFRDGRPARAGEVGALLMTSLDTEVRPLIRYVSGDLVKLKGAPCRCGCPYRTFSFEGRAKDYFEVGEKRRAVTQREIDLALGPLRGVAYFRLNISSESAPTAKLELVPAGAREMVEVESILSRLEPVLDKRVRISWKRSLPLTSPGGKLLSLESGSRSERRIYAPFLGER